MPTPDGRISTQQLCTDGVTERHIADNAVTGDQIAPGAVDEVAFAVGVRPVEIVDTLPLTATAGDVCYLTTDYKLYRYDGVAWTDTFDFDATSIAATAPL